MDDDWQTSFRIISDTHDRVFTTIDTAVRNEEQEDPQTAIVNYKLSIMLIDEALETPVGIPEDTTDDTWNQACQMIQKLKRTRGELVQRVSQLINKHPTPAPPIDTNSIPDADGFVLATDCSAAVAADPMAKRPWTYSELAAALVTMSEPSSSIAEAKRHTAKTQLIYMVDNVKLYHVRSSGDVTTTLENSVLRILCVDADEAQRLQTTFFMQLIPESLAKTIAPAAAEEATEDGMTPTPNVTPTPTARDSSPVENFDSPWLYPLVAGVSPCYYTKYGAFVFPDLHSSDPDASIGIVVDAEQEEYLLEVLVAILNGVVEEPRDDAAAAGRHRRSTTSETVSNNIVRGASYISHGLIFSSTKVGEFMEKSTPYVMSKLGRVPENQEQPVSGGVRTGVELAKTATGMAASVTGFVADKVSAATMALGRFLAPHVETQGTRLLSRMGYSQEEATEKMTDVFVIASGAVEGFGTVYSGLEQSASLLGQSISENTVRVIQHKYGNSAGELASGTFDTVGNVINISHNVSLLHPKSLVKKTAKNAGRVMFQKYNHSVDLNRPTIPASAMYPNLGEFSSNAIAKIE